MSLVWLISQASESYQQNSLLITCSLLLACESDIPYQVIRYLRDVVRKTGLKLCNTDQFFTNTMHSTQLYIRHLREAVREERLTVCYTAQFFTKTMHSTQPYIGHLRDAVRKDRLKLCCTAQFFTKTCKPHTYILDIWEMRFARRDQNFVALISFSTRRCTAHRFISMEQF
jgi:isochorismate hydrolase